MDEQLAVEFDAVTAMALGAISACCTLANALAKAGVLPPEAIDDLGHSFTSPIEGLPETNRAYARLNRLRPLIEAVTGESLAEAHRIAREKFKG